MSEQHPEHLQRAYAQIGRPAEEQFMSVAERWIHEGLCKGHAKGLQEGVEQGLEKGLQEGREQGLQEGLEKGLQEGVEQGLEKGRRDLFLMLLRQRFGPLPEPVEQRVQLASPADVDRWTTRLLAADSLDAVLAP